VVVLGNACRTQVAVELVQGAPHRVPSVPLAEHLAQPVGVAQPGWARSEPPWKRRRVLIRQRRLSTMASPRKYDQEFRERAVRMYSERLAEPGESKRGARRHVGALLDLNPETLRNWAEERDRVESGRSPAPRSAEAEEVRTLRRRVAELERANEILKTSAAFFAQAELDRRLR
jgi:transposase-like protein